MEDPDKKDYAISKKILDKQKEETKEEKKLDEKSDSTLFST